MGIIMKKEIVNFFYDVHQRNVSNKIDHLKEIDLFVGDKLFKSKIGCFEALFILDGENQIKKIAELYNNGKTGCQIAELLFNDRNYRVKINSLIRGDSYKEYSHLFNYRKYTQIGRRFSEETKNKISKANIGTTALSEKDINFIKENYLTTSGRKIAKLINKNHRTVAYYIKTKLKNGL
jgi:hypothetical protein